MNQENVPTQHQEEGNTISNTHQENKGSFPTTKPVRHHGISIWRICIGLLVILFGVQLLGQQYGWQWATSMDIWRLWPVCIILIGLSMIFRGRKTDWLIWLIALLIIAGAVIYNASTHTETETIYRSVAIDQSDKATSAQLTIDMGAAKLNLHGGSEKLISGTFESNVTDLTSSERLSEATQIIDLEAKAQRNFWFFHSFHNTLNLQLANTIPFELDIDSGAADIDMNLSDVQIKRLKIDSGASSIHLTLGKLLTETSVTIDSGAASLSVEVPSTSGLHVVLDGGASSKHLPTTLQKVSENVYKTENYTTAEHSIQLTIDAGASSITLTQIPS